MKKLFLRLHSLAASAAVPAALAFACMHSAATAGINAHNGSFFITYRDIAAPEALADVELRRTYNSSSQAIGWLGRGWGRDPERL